MGLGMVSQLKSQVPQPKLFKRKARWNEAESNQQSYNHQHRTPHRQARSSGCITSVTVSEGYIAPLRVGMQAVMIQGCDVSEGCIAPLRVGMQAVIIKGCDVNEGCIAPLKVGMQAVIIKGCDCLWRLYCTFKGRHSSRYYTGVWWQ